MFGLDFSKISEMLPLFEKAVSDTAQNIEDIKTELKSQRELLEQIKTKLGEDK